MIKQAMQGKAPAMYRRLSKSGELDVVVQERASAVTEAYQEAAGQAMMASARQTPQPPPMERVQALTQKQSAAAAEASAQATEFPSESEVA